MKNQKFQVISLMIHFNVIEKQKRKRNIWQEAIKIMAETQEKETKKTYMKSIKPDVWGEKNKTIGRD